MDNNDEITILQGMHSVSSVYQALFGVSSVFKEKQWGSQVEGGNHKGRMAPGRTSASS